MVNNTIAILLFPPLIFTEKYCNQFISLITIPTESLSRSLELKNGQKQK
jgi:hypothetical protein